MILAITLHNVPEGLAVGVAFVAAAQVMNPLLALSLAGGAATLAVGIALQNVPEGLGIAVPLRGERFSPFRAFWYGQLSAIVEPLAASLGAAAVPLVEPILPYALAFAAGAMLYVVVEESIAESQRGDHGDLATSDTSVGFTVTMMVLDVALGWLAERMRRRDAAREHPACLPSRFPVQCAWAIISWSRYLTGKTKTLAAPCTRLEVRTWALLLA